MTAPLWVFDLTSRFWELAGGEPPSFPRDLRPAIARAFPLTPVGLPNLRVAAVDGWLVRRLPGLLSQAGLQHVATRAFLPLEREPDGFYGRAAVRAADVAAQTGAITESEREGWLAALRAEQAAGNFLGGRVHIFCWGVKP